MTAMHLPLTSAKCKQPTSMIESNETCDQLTETSQPSRKNNRLSWPQFNVPTATSSGNIKTQRISEPHRVLYPEEAKVIEKATQIVMYVCCMRTAMHPQVSFSLVLWFLFN